MIYDVIERISVTGAENGTVSYRQDLEENHFKWKTDGDIGESLERRLDWDWFQNGNPNEGFSATTDTLIRVEWEVGGEIVGSVCTWASQIAEMETA